MVTQATDPGPAPARRRSPILGPRRVNLLLELLMLAVIGTGIGSWLVPIETARPFTVAHGLAAFGIVVVTPWKIRGSARTGFRRNPMTRWISAAFGVMVLGAAVLGSLHTAGIWHGVGEWSALWTHHLLGFASFPFLIWHLWSRRPAGVSADLRNRSSAPFPPAKVDADRRTLLAGGLVTTAAAAVLLSVEVGSRVAGTRRGRAGTGSREVGSYDPEAMPSTVWIDDTTPPDTNVEGWALTVVGEPVAVADLAAAAEPLTAALDCTGGWWSEQRWDVVPLTTLLDVGGGQSARAVKVTSATGYARLFAFDELEDVFVAVGYDGRPLAARHGAPVRLVVPGRRGPWWVKWVSSIDLSNRPAWSQLPLPPT